MVETMIKRVARAIYEEDPIVLGMLSDNDLCAIARAAIEAIYYFTPHMNGAGELAFLKHKGGASHNAVPAIYEAMISAALAEEKP